MHQSSSQEAVSSPYFTQGNVVHQNLSDYNTQIDELCKRLKESQLTNEQMARILAITTEAASKTSPGELVDMDLDPSGKKDSGRTTPSSGHDVPGLPRVDSKTGSEEDKFHTRSKDSPEAIIARRIGGGDEEIMAIIIRELELIEEKIFGRVATSSAGSSQGDHTTASVVLNEIVYNAVIGKTLAQAKKSLRELAEKLPFLNKKEFDSRKRKEVSAIEILEEIIEEYGKELKKKELDFDKDDQKDITQLLRRINAIRNVIADNEVIKKKFGELVDSLPTDQDKARVLAILGEDGICKEESDIQGLKNIIKYGQISANIPLIAKLQVALMKILNKRPHAAEERKRNPSKEFHAREEADAMYNLRLFILLCDFIDRYNKNFNNDEKNKLIEDFRAEVKETMRISTPKLKNDDVVNNNFLQFLGQVFNGAKLGLYLFPAPPKKENNKIITQGSVDKRWIESIAQELKNPNSHFPKKIAEYINILFDYGYCKTWGGGTAKDEEELEDELEVLYKAVAEHIVFTHLAFNELKSDVISKGNKERMIDSFLDYILATGGKNQGWGEYVIGERSSHTITLDKQTLFQEIQKQYEINYDKGQYTLKPLASEESDNKKSKADQSSVTQIQFSR